MESSDSDQKVLIIELANAVAQWFPDLEGRSIAASEIEPFNNITEVPTLPIAVSALLSETSDQTQNGASRVELTTEIMLVMMLKPVRYQRTDGAETPFYAFYNYEPIRDTLLENLKDWRTPRGGSVSFRQLDVQSNEFAVYVSFRLVAVEKWCPTSEPEKPYPLHILTRICPPSVPDICCECEPKPEPEDGCEKARERNPFGKESPNFTPYE